MKLLSAKAIKLKIDLLILKVSAGEKLLKKWWSIEMSSKFPFYCGRTQAGIVVAATDAFFIKTRASLGSERNSGCTVEW